MNNLFKLMYLITFSSISYAKNPSFSCDESNTGVEKTICSDPGLSVLDSRLSDLFKQNLSKGNSDGLKKSQLQWLKRRDKCLDKECIRREYNNRISFFDAFIHSQFQLKTVGSNVEVLAYNQKFILEDIVYGGQSITDVFKLKADGNFAVCTDYTASVVKQKECQIFHVLKNGIAWKSYLVVKLNYPVNFSVTRVTLPERYAFTPKNQVFMADLIESNEKYLKYNNKKTMVRIIDYNGIFTKEEELPMSNLDYFNNIENKLDL
jgi:uncharacterized protein YecT (DUF1311 family)